MKLDITTLDGQGAGSVELDEAIFEFAHLVAGLADALTAAHIPVFGPSAAAAASSRS